MKGNEVFFGKIKMKFCVIASGSKGNMTYVETHQVRILIDAGISFLEAKKRVDVDLNQLDAILITHEHIDHIKYATAIAKKTNAVVYIHQESFRVVRDKQKDFLDGVQVKFIESNAKYVIKDLTFLTLRLSHDSISCLGFIFQNEKRHLGYITDTGFLPIPYIELLKKVDSIIIESNHDIEMLNESERPWVLKNRIFSVRGHMSNYICGQILDSIIQAQRLSQIVLAHISEDCNTEEIAVDTVLSLIEREPIPSIIVAKQYQATALLEV